jgi:hypothetical protein
MQYTCTLHHKVLFFPSQVMDTELPQAYADTDDGIENSSYNIYEGISRLFPWYPDSFRFTDLPNEIRFCIYPYLCQAFHQSYCRYNSYCSCLNLAIPLNKQIYFEMLSCLYAKSYMSFTDATACYNFCQGINGERTKYIKRMKISYLGARPVTRLDFRKSFGALRNAGQLEEFELRVECLMFPPLLEDLENFVSLRKIIVWGNGSIKEDLVPMEDVLRRRALQEGKNLELSAHKWGSNEYEWTWELR